MVHTDIIQYLSEIDTNVFLYFNGIHSPFWDYFMTSFTGKIIWVPMYATILYILLKNFHWKAALCYVAAIALIITFADQMCSSIIRPVVARLRPSNPESPIVDMVYIVNNYRGELRFPVVSCSQFIRSCHVRGLHVPQTLAKHFHYRMGPLQLLHTRISRGTLSG